MSKTTKVKKLTCPAGFGEKEKMDGFIKRTVRPCDFFVDLVKTEALEAQGQLLLHLRDFHNFYWKRHGKKLVTRYSKQYAMRNK